MKFHNYRLDKTTGTIGEQLNDKPKLYDYWYGDGWVVQQKNNEKCPDEYSVVAFFVNEADAIDYIKFYD